MNHDQKHRIAAAAAAAAAATPLGHTQHTVAPIVHILQNCIPNMMDIKVDGVDQKRLVLVHTSGVVAYQCDLPLPLAKQIGTWLCAHPSIQIANGNLSSG